MSIDRKPSQRPRSHRAASEPIAPASILTGQQRGAIERAVLAAVENNAVYTMHDAANRTWFVGIDIVDNRSTVLIQARRGQHARGQNLSTATLSAPVIASAIAAVDAALG